jgi:uncharacterized protein with HEPN domain
MPLDDASRNRIQDMLSHCELVQDMLAGRSKESLEVDRWIRLALERAIEIIGEAARGVGKDVQDANPHIPWRKIIAQRHVLAHDYAEVQFEIVHRVATIHIPALIPQLEALLAEA